jgi:hypothetical protein
VLAAVSGSQVIGGSVASIALQIVVGLVVLSIFSLMVLPRLVRIGFHYLGTDRIVRYLLAIASFLAAATLAGILGIEGLVGAFFAGLGLNRLVPNEGPLMERIDFFGSAVFVPVFLISVGMLLKPSVMIEGETLKLAGLFILASLGGKAVAVLVSKRPMRLTIPESALLLGLTVPQAAATLAATVIGYDIGLFDQSVVNAVLVLILVTIVVATILVERSKRSVAVPTNELAALGKRVLVALEDPAQARISFAIAARVAVPDSGIVRAFLGSSRLATAADEAHLVALHSSGFAMGVDVDPALLVNSSLAEGIIDIAAVHRPSLVLVGQRSASAHPALGGTGEAVAASMSAPVAIVVGDAEEINEVILVETEGDDGVRRNDGASEVAAEVARRVGGRRVSVRRANEAGSLSGAAAGQLWIASADSWQVLAAGAPPGGSALMLVLESPPAGESS